MVENNQEDSRCQSYHRLQVSRAFAVLFVLLASIFIVALLASQAKPSLKWVAVIIAWLAGA
jgi:hypothetical protein